MYSLTPRPFSQAPWVHHRAVLPMQRLLYRANLTLQPYSPASTKSKAISDASDAAKAGARACWIWISCYGPVVCGRTAIPRCPYRTLACDRVGSC